MLTIRVTQDTFFKQSTADANTLPESQKVSVENKTELKIKSIRKKNNHYFVKLAEEITPGSGVKSGFFFADHLQVEETRGIWITNIASDILMSKANIERDLQQLKDLGFNAIYPVVWNKGFAFFDSSVVDNTVSSNAAKLKSVGLESELAGRDILAEIIEINREKKLGFRIIAWFEYGTMILPKSPLAQAKPEWLMVNKDNEKTVKNEPQFRLNPTDPEVQKFFTDLISEAVKKYEIDGIQLDDHFGIPKEMSFDESTLKRFKTDHPRAENPVTKPDSELWEKWRMEQLTNLLRQIRKAVKAEKDDCIISISPNPLKFSKDHASADWENWIEKELVDELVVQVYRDKEDTLEENMTLFNGEIDKDSVKSSRNHIPTVIGILTGLNLDQRRVKLNLIQSQTQAVRDRDFAGFSYFFFGSLLDLRPTSETLNTRTVAFDNLLSIDQFV